RHRMGSGSFHELWRRRSFPRFDCQGQCSSERSGEVARDTRRQSRATKRNRRTIHPREFRPEKELACSGDLFTSDFKRQNRDDLVEFYRRVGLAEGWVLLAGDGPQPARNDPAAWRGAVTLAAIDALHRSFTGSQNWPIACAGFSGGGKGAGLIAPLLARNGCRVIGIYLTGANEDRLSEGYARVRPPANFLMTPVYISAGRDDRIATVEQQYDVGGSIKRTGFQRLRIGTFHGGHEVNDAQTSIALR